MYNRGGHPDQQKEDGALRLPASPSRQNQLFNSLSLSNSLLQQMQMNTVAVIPPGMMMGSSTLPTQNPHFLLGRSTFATEAARRTHLAQPGELDRQQMLQHLLGGGVNTIKEEEARRELENHLMLRDLSEIDPLSFTNHISSIDSLQNRHRLLARTMARNVGLQYQFPRQPDEIITNSRFPANLTTEIKLAENESNKRKSSFEANGIQTNKNDNQNNSSHNSSAPDINVSAANYSMPLNKDNESSTDTCQGNSKKDKFLKRKSVVLNDQNDSHNGYCEDKTTFPIKVKPSRKRFRLNSDGRFPSFNQIWTNLDKKIISNYPEMDNQRKRKLLGALFVDLLYTGNDLIPREEESDEFPDKDIPDSEKKSQCK